MTGSAPLHFICIAIFFGLVGKIALAQDGELPGPSRRIIDTTLELRARTTSIRLPFGLLSHEYRSRSEFDGILGKGWCTFFYPKGRGIGFKYFAVESKVILSRDSVSIQSCGVIESDDIYRMPQGSPGNRSLAELREAGDVILYSSDKSKTARLSKSGVSLHVYSERVQTFGENGLLVAVHGVEIQYNEHNRPTRFSSGSGDFASLEYGNQLLTGVFAGSGALASFGYKGGQVSSIVDSNKNRTEYFYGKSSNLQFIIEKEKPVKVYFYDELHDVVTSDLSLYEDGRVCGVMFSRISGKQAYKNQSASFCGGRITKESHVTVRRSIDGKPNYESQVRLPGQSD